MGEKVPFRLIESEEPIKVENHSKDHMYLKYFSIKYEKEYFYQPFDFRLRLLLKTIF